LAYARSRYFESFVDGEWRVDGTADLGRIKRQQAFVNVALKTALDRVKGNPLVAGDVLASSTSALRIDRDLDVLDAAAVLRKAFGTGLSTYSLPVYGKDISGKAVLLMADSAEGVLAYFRGNVAVPPVVNP
jgi:anionic cell wall polymer biosynthesis LytR-Cps2A-Psr (LCP) family protein